MSKKQIMLISSIIAVLLLIAGAIMLKPNSSNDEKIDTEQEQTEDGTYEGQLNEQELQENLDDNVDENKDETVAPDTPTSSDKNTGSTNSNNTSSNSTSKPNAGNGSSSSNTGSNTTKPEIKPDPTPTPDPTPEPTPTKSAKELYQKLVDSNAGGRAMSDMSSDALSVYGLSESDVKSYTLHITMMSPGIDEVFVVEAADGKAEAVESAMKDRIEVLKNEKAFYPADMDTAENATIYKNGNFIVLYAVGNESIYETAKSIIGNY